MFENPLAPFLDKQETMILDGGLATELEARGFNLNDELWSARLLNDAPDVIKAVHLDYLEAGADCIISASYQATVPGFMRKGFSREEAETLLQTSVLIAREACDTFWSAPENRQHRIRPLVAASVGPYGAFLADGSEYRGHYGLSEDELYEFHRQRWHLLVACRPDLLACETMPSAIEAWALRRLTRETPQMPAWFSFSCRDERHINDGTPLRDVVKRLDSVPQIVAVGINCTAPRYISALVCEAQAATEKAIVVYPNSGERYDVQQRRWIGLSKAHEFATQSRNWRQAGASLIGGCCRTNPSHIGEIRRLQLQSD